MFTLQRILLPVDFSERSAGAARYAKALACRFQSALHVVHVVDFRSYGMLGMELDEAAIDKLAPGAKSVAQYELDAFSTDDLKHLKIRRALLFGDPGRQIVKYAHEHDMSLIVLPTHGYGPFRRFILGSVTAKVLHDAECPVWTGAHMQDPVMEPVAFHKIVCAIDLENHSINPLSWAWEMGQALGGSVTIVHAIPALGSERPEYLEGKWSEYLIQQTMARIQELQDEAGTTAAVCIRPGEIAPAVAAAAKDLQANIVVIGRGLASAIAGRLRTYSYAIIRESPCPVVSI